MAEKQMTVRQMETRIDAINESIGKLRERIRKLDAEKKALQSRKRRAAAAKAKPAKKAAAKKTTAAKKKVAPKKTTARKTPAKKPKDENLLDGIMDTIKDAGFSPEDLLKSILGGK